MTRYIRDFSELSEDDEDEYLSTGWLARRRRRSSSSLLLGAVMLALVVAAMLVAASVVLAQQEDDAFCVSCHTPQHRTYLDRAEAASAGALADDLSSYHYQHLRGTGGSIRCIDCHRGDDTPRAHLETLILSAEMAARWLVAADDPRVSKTTIITTVSQGLTLTVPQTTLALRRPHLTNDSCLSCHRETLLLVGMDNHMHNMLPPAFMLWRNGARLIVPPDAADPQAVLARGLSLYATTVGCHNCHQTHARIEEARYLNAEVVKHACEQCHREAGAGPIPVVISAEGE